MARYQVWVGDDYESLQTFVVTADWVEILDDDAECYQRYSSTYGTDVNCTKIKSLAFFLNGQKMTIRGLYHPRRVIDLDIGVEVITESNFTREVPIYSHDNWPAD